MRIQIITADGAPVMDQIDVFIDTHGGFWEPCLASEPGAEAFGGHGSYQPRTGSTAPRSYDAGVSRQRVFAMVDGHMVSFLPRDVPDGTQYLSYGEICDGNNVVDRWFGDDDVEWARLKITRFNVA